VDVFGPMNENPPDFKLADIALDNLIEHMNSNMIGSKEF
jgi:hypothetical protein